jgi:hypothetical protein
MTNRRRSRRSRHFGGLPRRAETSFADALDLVPAPGEDDLREEYGRDERGRFQKDD